MTSTTAALLTVYWRPSCPFCSTLRRKLRKAGIAATEVNIWEEPGGAAVLRSIATGNETVPTVVVGDVGLVNPTVSAVLRALADAGEELPDARRPGDEPYSPDPGQSPLERVVKRLLRRRSGAERLRWRRS